MNLPVQLIYANKNVKERIKEITNTKENLHQEKVITLPRGQRRKGSVDDRNCQGMEI
jgi:hypothetical protein